MELSRQEYWSGLPFPSPEELPNPGIGPWSPASQADSLPFEPQGSRDQGLLQTKPPNSHQPCRGCAGLHPVEFLPYQLPPSTRPGHPLFSEPTHLLSTGGPPTPSATPGHRAQCQPTAGSGSEKGLPSRLCAGAWKRGSNPWELCDPGKATRPF